MEISTALPLVEKYRDYRKFMSDFYKFKKTYRQSFSYRQFSQKAGLKSPNYLQLVMKGERNLSSEVALSVAKAMDLTAQQQKYFVSLVRQENAQTDDQLSQAKEESLVALKKLVAKHLQLTQESVLSEWHTLLVRELVSLKDFELTGEYVAQKLNGLVTADQGEKALSYLVEAGFIIEKSGQWVSADPMLDTGDTIFQDEKIRDYHSKNLKVWSQNLKKFDHEHLELGILNLSVSAKRIPQLKQKIRDFQDQLLGWLEDDKDLDSVVQVGVYLIPHAVETSKKN